MPLRLVLLVLLFGAAAVSAAGAPLEISLVPDPDNPLEPRMGDTLRFHTLIRNTEADPVTGVIAWLSLVQTDPGLEQPVDLEDWSAHKAIALDVLMAGAVVETEWPIRLIQAGHYRVVVSASAGGEPRLAASPFRGFIVEEKPVVESGRVLPVAVGIPLLLGGLMFWRRRGWRSAVST